MSSEILDMSKMDTFRHITDREWKCMELDGLNGFGRVQIPMVNTVQWLQMDAMVLEGSQKGPKGLQKGSY